MTAIDEALKSIIKKFSADVGVIHRLNLRDNCLYLVAYTSAFPEQLIQAACVIPIEKGTLAAVTVLKKQPIIMADISNDPSQMIVPMERNLGFHGIITVPIFNANHNVVGNLGIGCNKKRVFSRQETNNLIEEGKKLADLLVEEEIKLVGENK